MSDMQPKRVYAIGASPDCDIVVTNPVVSGRHCLLAEYEQGFALEDAGSTNGTYVNGRRLAPNQPVWISRSDVVTLGANVPFPWPGQQAQSMPQQPFYAPPAPSPGVSSGGRQATVAMPGQRVITIGRNEDNDQVLAYPMISGNHARIIEEPNGRLSIEDLQSTNGTAVGNPSNRIPPRQPVEISSDTDLYFGSFKIPAQRLLGGPKLALGNVAGPSMAFRGDRMVIGRDPSAELPLDYPMISWRHAELTREAGQIYVRDLGSRNGTYVDGVRIYGKTPLRPGSQIALGSFQFDLTDASGNLARREYNGNVTIEAVQVTVDIKAKGRAQRLVEPVSLTIFPSEVVCVMGPAGAGKTTLMKALNGYTAPTYGQVLFNGAELYKSYDQFRLQLGYVPQDDIMHSLLTVNEALYFTAKLRTDLRDAEIKARIQYVLTKLNIDDIGDRLIGSPEKKVISGGQRKRLNIAMELLSDPNVLFLDEPTTGLSSYDAYQVVKVLRDLGNSGKTVVLTIHQPSIDIFKEFDNLVMVSRDKGSKNSGALAYYGPAYPDSIQFFGGEMMAAPGAKTELSPEMLLDGLAKRPTQEWVGRYSQTRYKKEFIESRTGQLPSRQAQRPQQTAVRKPGIDQWITLMKRNATLRFRDKGQMIFTAAQSILFPLLMCIMYHGLTYRNFLDRYHDPGNAMAKFRGALDACHFLLVVAAVWFGVNNAARDIVGEWAIYLRERMVSLKLPSYVFSKLGMLAVICGAQCAALLAIVYPIAQLRSGFGKTFLMLFLASLGGAALGLLISAFAETTEAAIAVLPIPLLFMILLSGGIKPLEGGGEKALSFAFPSRWAFETNFLQESEARRPEMLVAAAVQAGQIQQPATDDQEKQAEQAIPPQVMEPLQTCNDQNQVYTNSDLAYNWFKCGDRFSYGVAFSVLVLMIAGLSAGVIGVLRSRDIQR